MAETKAQNIQFIPVTGESIEAYASDIGLEESFASSTAVKGIKKMHFITALEHGKFIARNNHIN